MKMFGIVTISSLLPFLLAGSGNALANDFYAGKTIRVIVGFSAGGGYDTYTRAIARHMGKHIPGSPSFTVENMDGAGSLIAANYTYNKADRDGGWNPSLIGYGRIFSFLGQPARKT